MFPVIQIIRHLEFNFSSNRHAMIHLRRELANRLGCFFSTCLLTLFTSFTLYAIFSLHFKHHAPIASLDSHFFSSPFGAISIICSQNFVLVRFILNSFGWDLCSTWFSSSFSSTFVSIVRILWSSALCQLIDFLPTVS